jgi:hypothetical protein
MFQIGVREAGRFVPRRDIPDARSAYETAFAFQAKAAAGQQVIIRDHTGREYPVAEFLRRMVQGR